MRATILPPIEGHRLMLSAHSIIAANFRAHEWRSSLFQRS
jgi:hypothetical protein